MPLSDSCLPARSTYNWFYAQMKLPNRGFIVKSQDSCA